MSARRFRLRVLRSTPLFKPSPTLRHLTVVPARAPSSEPSSDLVRRVREGDTLGFRELYRQHVGRVYALCLRMSADGARAEELTQDVFVRAWEKLGSFRGESAFSSWLHRIAVNIVLADRRSSRRREQRVAVTDDLGSRERPGEESPAGLGIDLERAIAALPAGAREVFLLHDVEGFRHEEIAALTGIAAGTSKAQLFRARRLLREALER